jgi:hypothetical protein
MKQEKVELSIMTVKYTNNNFVGVRFYLKKDPLLEDIEPVSSMIINIPIRLFWGIMVYII